MRRFEQPRRGRGGWIIGLAAAVLAGCLALSAWLVYAPGDAPAPPPALERAATSPAPSPPGRAPTQAPRPTPRPVATPAASPGVKTPEAPTMSPPEEGPPDEQPASSGTGIGLFHPGIKPIKKGIVVPEGFELPPGYMRHVQTTDDGQELASILMFHPDYKPVNANGQPVDMPKDRIVPPELAPPGMPIKLLEIPKTESEPGR